MNSCTVEEAKTKIGNDEYAFIDVREKAKIENDGCIPGAVNIPRGMLEFCIDPASPYYNPVFASGKNVSSIAKAEDGPCWPPSEQPIWCGKCDQHGRWIFGVVALVALVLLEAKMHSTNV